MKSKHRTNLNAYLFANLVILCILLISLWNRKPVWDVSLRFPNLLLILVILNSILIFKNLIFARTPIKAVRKTGSPKTGKSLAGLRGIVSGAVEINDELYQKALLEMHRLYEGEGVALLLPENSFFKVTASQGNLPPAFSGARLYMRDNAVMIKYPGSLGEEEVCKNFPQHSPVNFKSTVTRLDCQIFPLQLPKSGKGCLFFFSREGQKTTGLPYASTALFFETLITLVNSVASSGDQRYKDKSTGLLKYDCFPDSFETEIERSERYQQDMTLFSVKIRYCDGCSGEDRVLMQKAAAIALKQSLRRLDLMFCGETDCEFIAILTETSAQVAEIVAQRVQKSFAKQVEKTNVLNSDKKILLIGSATYPSHATHGHGLIEKSREALSQAESENRDFVSYS
ncbi:MAG: diguanylate cyclase domain-containing protein [Candidatus Rifleibacteriota bacterium]